MIDLREMLSKFDDSSKQADKIRIEFQNQLNESRRNRTWLYDLDFSVGIYLDVMNLSDIEFRNCKFMGHRNINFSNSVFKDCSFSEGNYEDCDFRSSRFENADFSWCKILSCNFSDATFKESSFNRSECLNCDFTDVEFVDTNLDGIDLSRSKLPNQLDYLKENFEFTKKGLICYKTIGEHYRPNPNWKIAPGEYIEETVLTDRTNECGCGINVGTAKYVFCNSSIQEIWVCLIEFQDFIDLVVPFNSCGKIRAGRVKLLKTITHRQLRNIINKKESENEQS